MSLKKIDIFSYSPLQFRTWCGVFCSILTFALVLIFGFIQFYEFMPRLIEYITPDKPTFMVGFENSFGSIATNDSWGAWEAYTISWTS